MNWLQAYPAGQTDGRGGTRTFVPVMPCLQSFNSFHLLARARRDLQSERFTGEAETDIKLARLLHPLTQS